MQQENKATSLNISTSWHKWLVATFKTQETQFVSCIFILYSTSIICSESAPDEYQT